MDLLRVHGAPALGDGLSPYVSRTSLEEKLRELLLSPHAVPCITHLLGPGGFGKTQLAAAVCQDPLVGQHFGGGVFWVTVGIGPNISKLWEATYAAIRTSPSISTDYPTLPEVYSHSHLINIVTALSQNGRVLLVLDDVWMRHSINPLLKEMLQAGVSCLVTTRSPEVASEGPSRTARVEAMEEAAAILFHGMRPSPLEKELGKQLLGRVGFWPLAVKLLHRTLSCMVSSVVVSSLSSGISILSDRLAEKGVSGFEESMVPSEESRLVQVTACVDAGLDVLNSIDRSRCYELAIFPEDTLVSVAAIRAAWDVSDVEARESLLSLLKVGILQSLDFEKELFSLHDMIFHVLRKKLCDVTDVHRRLVENVGVPPLSDDYLRMHLLTHTIGAGKLDLARQQLKTGSWLRSQIAHQSGMWKDVYDRFVKACAQLGIDSSSTLVDAIVSIVNDSIHADGIEQTMDFIRLFHYEIGAESGRKLIGTAFKKLRTLNAPNQAALVFIKYLDIIAPERPQEVLREISSIEDFLFGESLRRDLGRARTALLLLHSRVLYRQQDYKRAEELAQQAKSWAEPKDFPRVLAQLAGILLFTYRIDECRACVEELKDSESGDDDSQLNAARRMVDVSFFECNEQALNEAATLVESRVFSKSPWQVYNLYAVKSRRAEMAFWSSTENAELSRMMFSECETYWTQRGDVLGQLNARMYLCECDMVILRDRESIVTRLAQIREGYEEVKSKLGMTAALHREADLLRAMGDPIRAAESYKKAVDLAPDKYSNLTIRWKLNVCSEDNDSELDSELRKILPPRRWDDLQLWRLGGKGTPQHVLGTPLLL